LVSGFWHFAAGNWLLANSQLSIKRLEMKPIMGITLT
jgi:hypothetical protein